MVEPKKELKHVRVFLGVHPFVIKESANPHFETTDGDFIRKAHAQASKLSEQLEPKEPQAPEPQEEPFVATLKDLIYRIAEIEGRQAEFDGRLVEVEDFIESIVKPAHREPQTVPKIEERVQKPTSSELRELRHSDDDDEMREKILLMEEKARRRRRG